MVNGVAMGDTLLVDVISSSGISSFDASSVGEDVVRTIGVWMGEIGVKTATVVPTAPSCVVTEEGEFVHPAKATNVRKVSRQG